jgi:hypothetical protein
MCIEIKDLQELEENVKEDIFTTSNELLKSKSLHKKAKYYVVLKSIKDTIEYEMEKYKIDLLNEKVEEYFIDEDLKVVYQEGVKQTAIDQIGLYNAMEEDGRVKDFLSVCSVSESNLKKMEDGEELITTFKYDLGTTKAPSIKILILSKDDKKRLVEEKKIINLGD